MMVKHEEKELVALAISRLLATVDTSEPGTSLRRCSDQHFSRLSTFFSSERSWFLSTVYLVVPSSSQLYA